MYLYRVAKYKRPQIFLEPPHRVATPIVISRYKHKKPVTISRTTGNSWGFQNKDKYENVSTGTTIYRWYKKRRALKSLKREHKRIQQEKAEKAYRQREEELLQQLLKRENYQQEKNRKHTEKVALSNEIQKTKGHTKATKKLQGKAISAKPKAQSKYVTVNKHNRYLSLSDRFVNWLYRTCCQLYCCISIVLILGIAFVILI